MKNINEYKAQTIGVEIEMTGISRNAATKVLEEHFGNRHTYIGNGCYDTRTVADETGRKWTIMRDSSIRPEYKSGRTAGDDYKVEFVTPILHYDDIEDLQEIVRKFRRAGATVNQSTGMHIHIGAKDFTAQTVRNLVNALSSKEDILYDALQVHPNRIGYCKKTDRRFLKELNEKKPQTLDDLAMRTRRRIPATITTIRGTPWPTSTPSLPSAPSNSEPSTLPFTPVKSRPRYNFALRLPTKH